MKADIRSALIKMATFMGEDCGSSLSNDDELVEKIIKQSSIGFMKEKYSVKPPGVQFSNDPNFSMFRKGVVNDWKNMLTKEQNQSLTERFKEEAAKNPILNSLWEDMSWLHDQSNSE